jgi:hypothetical protein
MVINSEEVAMKKTLSIHLVSALVALAALASLAGNALAQQTGIPQTDERFAATNRWLHQENLSITRTVTQAFTDGYVVMEGQGLPAAGSTSVGQRRLTAQRAAEVVAYRNLAQFLDGVAVVGDTTTRDMQIRYDTVRTAVSAFIKGAQVIYKDYNDQEGAATVLIKVGMSGPASFSDTMYRRLMGDPAVAPAIATPARPAAPPPVVAPMPVVPYDGMIIDATGQSFRPALINRIFTVRGEVLYDPSRVAQKILVEKGCGEYTNSVDKAKSALQGRGVTNPLIVKAAGTAGPTDLQVTDEDAGKIFSANQKTNFLAGARIAFVLK